MTRSAKNPFPFADSVAAQFEQARSAKGMSLSGVHRESGVSRRHLAELQKGANVTLLLIRDVMSALDIEALDIGGGKRLGLAGDGESKALRDVIEDLDQAGALISRSAARMRSLFRPRDPMETDTRDLATRASNLIDEFTARVRNSESDEEVDELERLVHASSLRTTTAPKPSATTRARKANTARG